MKKSVYNYLEELFSFYELIRSISTHDIIKDIL